MVKIDSAVRFTNGFGKVMTGVVTNRYTYRDTIYLSVLTPNNGLNTWSVPEDEVEVLDSGKGKSEPKVKVSTPKVAKPKVSEAPTDTDIEPKVKGTHKINLEAKRRRIQQSIDLQTSRLTQLLANADMTDKKVQTEAKKLRGLIVKRNQQLADCK